MEYIEFKKIKLKTHQTLTEKWVQDRIVENPTILGLGELDVRDKERKQAKAGRLDLLLEDSNDENKRYTVELQLGKTDESHIIRTIEYWDIEQKRFPQYQHIAVIVAEDITSRFLNVISLFNRNIPLIAIQMNALEIDEKVGLHFTKVLDETHLITTGDIEKSIPASKEYWEKKASNNSLELVDELLSLLVKRLSKNLSLKYNRREIIVEKNGVKTNFVRFKPRKSFVNVFVLLEDKHIYKELDNSSIDYEVKDNEIRLRMNTPATYLTVEVGVSSVSSFKGRLTLVELTHWRSVYAQPLYTVCRASSTSFTF